MQTFKNSVKAALLLTTMLTVASAQAAFTLDTTNSSVNFLSTKNVNVTESHTFDQFSGSLSDNGELNLNIDLTSVNTLIPIRNERMQSMLFNVTDFATASFSAKLDNSLLKLAPGQSRVVSVSGDLSISGTTNPVSFDVRVVGLEDGSISATTIKPTVLNAAEFGLEGGVEALREVAMLQNISQSVPFSFSVVFAKD